MVRVQTHETPCPYRDAAPLLALRLPSIERSVSPVALSPTRSPQPASPARHPSRAPLEKRTRPRHTRHAVALRAHPDKIPSFPPVVQHRTRQSQSLPRHLSAAGKYIPRRSSACVPPAIPQTNPERPQTACSLGRHSAQPSFSGSFRISITAFLPKVLPIGAGHYYS